LADQRSGHRAISTEYKAYHERRTLEARQDAANQEVKAIHSRVNPAAARAVGKKALAHFLSIWKEDNGAEKLAEASAPASVRETRAAMTDRSKAPSVSASAAQEKPGLSPRARLTRIASAS
jgi:hypothetical protein